MREGQKREYVWGENGTKECVGRESSYGERESVLGESGPREKVCVWSERGERERVCVDESGAKESECIG